MLGLIWLLVIGVLVVGLFLVFGKAAEKRSPDPDPNSAIGLRRTVFALKMGDIVQYDARDWVVEGVLVYDEAGFKWLEYLLQDQDEIRWLSVEEDDRIELLWMAPCPDLDVARPGATVLQVAGEQYQLQESGTAQMTRRGNTLNRQAEECRYYDYIAEDNRGNHLSVENWNGDIEVTRGQTIRPQDLQLLPGDGAQVYNARD